MAIESLTTSIDLVNKVFSLLKNARDLLPKSPQRTEATRALDEAERAFRTAEAQAAKDLGHHLCQCTWPPQIMLFTGKRHQYKCPKCENELDTAPASVSLDPIRRKRFDVF